MAIYSTEHRNFKLQVSRTLYEGATLLVCKGVTTNALVEPAPENILSEHTLNGGRETEAVLWYTSGDVTVDSSANNSGDPTYLLVRDIVGKIQALYRIPIDAVAVINGGQSIVQGTPVAVQSIRVTEGNSGGT